MTTNEMFLRIQNELEEIRGLLTERTDEVLDIEGVQRLTGLSKSAIYQKTCSRNAGPPELPHYRQGKRLYFRKSEIVKWLTSTPIKNRAAIESEARKHCASR